MKTLTFAIFLVAAHVCFAQVDYDLLQVTSSATAQPAISAASGQPAAAGQAAPYPYGYYNGSYGTSSYDPYQDAARQQLQYRYNNMKQALSSYAGYYGWGSRERDYYNQQASYGENLWVRYLRYRDSYSAAALSNWLSQSESQLGYGTSSYSSGWNTGYYPTTNTNYGYNTGTNYNYGYNTGTNYNYGYNTGANYNYGYNTSNYGYSPTPVYTTDCYGYSNTNYGYSNTNYGYGNTNYGYGNTNYGYGNTNYGYGNTNYGYGNRNYGYSNSRYYPQNSFAYPVYANRSYVDGLQIGNGVSNIVRGSRYDNTFQTVGGVLSTAGGLIDIINGARHGR